MPATMLKNRLEKLLQPECCLFHEKMSAHTTFQAGGEAFCLVYPQNVKQLKQIVMLCKEENFPFFVIGKGSNLLVSDAGYDGVVISLEKMTGEIRVEGGKIFCDAGVSLAVLAKRAAKENLTGLEFAAGIPGTVGGGLFMNAGAYGGEMKQVVTKATVLTCEGDVKVYPVEEMELDYRTSRFERSGEIILSAEFELAEGREEEILAVMKDLNGRRRDKQPLEYPSAGSTFKRPTGYFAGKLIQDSGLSGFSVGGACVSEKHCGFVVNKGGATAGDIYELCQEVSRIVEEKYQVKLELEVRLIGKF